MSKAYLTSYKAKQKPTAPADSHMLSRRSTNTALTSLILEFERDPVLSSRYGRSY